MTATAASLAEGAGDGDIPTDIDGELDGAPAVGDGDAPTPHKAGDGLGDAPVAAVEVARGATVEVGSGRTVGVGVGLGVGLGVDWGVGFGVGLGVGLGVAGMEIDTEPAPSVASNLSRLIASNVIVCLPAGSLPDQLKTTFCFQSVPPPLDMVCVTPPTRTLTQSAGDPSRFR
jgi:hypothetical protein